MAYALPLAFILFLIIPWPGFFCALRVAHSQSGQVMLTFPFFFRHTFFLSYTHSIYQAPVVEELEVQCSAIHLKEILTTSWGVVEYYNIPGTPRQEGGKIRIGEINFRVPELTVMIGFTGKQRITWEDRTYFLDKLGSPGEALNIEPTSLSPAGYLWEKVKRNGGRGTSVRRERLDNFKD